MKLLLWDIDGTLLASGGAGARALEQTVTDVFGYAANLSDIDWAGRTDQWITGQIFAKYGIEHTTEHADRLIDSYLAGLPEHLTATTNVLPGVVQILEVAHGRDDITQGLLTGNLERGAKTKLSHFDLWDYFPFGAFADDSAQRNDLGAHAVRRAADHTGYTFPAHDVWIIGDTPHDIECGKVIGARTLAVATGRYSADELNAHEPDAFLPDLSDVEQFWAIVQ